jgi:hypothetical protein
MNNTKQAASRQLLAALLRGKIQRNIIEKSRI